MGEPGRQGKREEKKGSWSSCVVCLLKLKTSQTHEARFFCHWQLNYCAADHWPFFAAALNRLTNARTKVTESKAAPVSAINTVSANGVSLKANIAATATEVSFGPIAVMCYAQNRKGRPRLGGPTKS